VNGYFVTKHQPAIEGTAISSKQVSEEFDGLDKAMIEACKLAKIDEKDAVWKTVNDGSRPGCTQVYELRRPDGSWSKYNVLGPHIGTGKST
jgi:hypothetical protein